MGRITLSQNQPTPPVDDGIDQAFGSEVALDRDPRTDRAKAAFVASLIAMATGIPALEIVGRSRTSAAASRARHIAMYLAHVGFGWPLSRVGLAFGRDRSTAAHACHLVEDRRDDRSFDEYLSALENCMRAAPEGLLA